MIAKCSACQQLAVLQPFKFYNLGSPFYRALCTNCSCDGWLRIYSLGMRRLHSITEEVFLKYMKLNKIKNKYYCKNYSAAEGRISVEG